MNIIKINEDVFETIQNNSLMPLDREHIPFTKMCIAFPYSFLRSSEEMIEDSMKEFKRNVNQQGMGYKHALEVYAKELEKAKRDITKYVESDLHLIFELETSRILIKHSNPSILGHNGMTEVLFDAFCPISIIPVPSIKTNEIARDGFWFYMTMYKLVSGIYYALTNKHVEISEVKQIKRADTIHKKGKRKIHNNIRYITNIKHLVYRETNPEVTRKHIITKEAWEVNGHWRHYKSGKKTWIPTYIKGDKDKFNEEDNILKLTQVLFKDGEE